MINKKVELLVEGKTVQLFGDESFSLSFSIDDINDIGKKSAAYSKEISIPATDINNAIFTSLFDVTIEGGFNPISRKRAVLYVDSMPVMQGYFKMLGVTIKDGKNVTYNGQLFEEQINFVAALDEFLLENLSIPLTGTTSPVISPPYSLLTTFNITGIGDRFGTGIYTSSGLYWADATSYSGVTFGSGFYGTISSQNRSTAGIPAGTSWSPASMSAYEAIVDQYIELDINMALSTINYATYQYRVIVSDYATPTSGLFTDYVVTSGTFASPVSGIGVTATLTLTGIGIALRSGDKFRVEIWNTNGKNYTTSTGSTINGRIYSSSFTTTTTGFTTNIGNIIRNINLVNTSDDYPIVFPLVDYSQNYKYYDKNNSSKYTYLSPDYRIQINSDNLRPMTFVKTVWDAIFKQAGFKYKSSFLNSTTFKTMVIGGGIDDKEISSLVFESRANENMSTSGFINNVNMVNTKDTQIVNTSGQVTNYRYNEISMSNVEYAVSIGSSKIWAISNIVDSYVTYIPSRDFVNVNAHTVLPTPFAPTLTSYYGYNLTTVSTSLDRYGVFPTAPYDAKYRVNAKLTAFSNPTLVGSTAQNLSKKYFIQLQKLSIGSYRYYPNSSTAPAFDKWSVIKEKIYITTGGTSGETFSIDIDETFDLKQGDMIRVIIMGDPNTQFPSYGGTLIQSINIDVNPNNTFFKFYKMGAASNVTFTNAASLLPKNFKQKDFILQLSKMFNLYFEADKEDSKTLIVEPRDTYYELGVIQNWSKKIDYTKDFNIEILSHDFPKTSYFKYADDDKDYLSSQYTGYTANKLIFGSYQYTSPNEYNTDEDTLELKFAPSYIQKLPDSDMRITKILNPSLFDPDSTSKNLPFKISPRIMMYKKVATPATEFNVYVGNTPTAVFVPYISLAGYNNISVYQYKLDYYGYAGHLNDPKIPTFDLNWYTDLSYLPGTTGTTQNLINVFYKNQLIELTDQTARKVTCFVELTAVDIVNLRFCDVFYFNQEYWRLLEISDYDTSSDVNKTTKCTFIKIVRAQTNGLIDYQAFGYLGISGGSAGGILGNTDPE